MTESARVKELEAELVKWNRAAQEGHKTPCDLGTLCPYCEIERLKSDRDAQAALVERMREAFQELCSVAALRGDSTLPHPSDDPLPWTARMSTAWDNAIAALDLPPSSALQEFKERCWKEGADAMLQAAFKNLSAECLDDSHAAEVLGWAANALRSESSVAELKKEGR